LGISDEKELDEVFKGADVDENGTIEYTEFLSGFMDHRA